MIIDGAKRTVLVIEDNELNREILCEILSPEYSVLQAENGKEGLAVLEEKRALISLVLLDLEMPVMTGYEFLDVVSNDEKFANIPIIVTTSNARTAAEIHCLENGATDFVTKPYNPDIVLRRLKSIIRLRESSSVLSQIKQDPLTGLFNRDYFFVDIENVLKSDPDTPYDVVCSNIISFKIINERYGSEKGDELLVRVADELRKNYPKGSIIGRIDGDIFAVMTPHRPKEEHLVMTGNIVANSADFPIPNVSVCFGLYQNVSHSLASSIICDNARIAIESIKDKYGKYLAEYDETVKLKLIREHLILNSVENALAEKQFLVYYQPKFDLPNGKVGGAEALVRWIHPEYGFMNPGEFIPLFEKNGFIARLDYYMIETVCTDLGKWLEGGHDAVPVSINVSRADFDDPNLVGNIIEIADRHGIPHDLLHIEVTESAYTDMPDRIRAAVGEMREHGLRIELDDFGAGYSSLNVLSELEIDVLKLDMSLVRSMGAPKQDLILSHIFSLSHALGMKVVAEGVETEKQAETLLGMGCNYAQGYFYSKPVPKVDFERYLTEHM